MKILIIMEPETPEEVLMKADKVFLAMATCYCNQEANKILNHLGKIADQVRLRRRCN